MTDWYVFGVSLRLPLRQLEYIKLDNANEGLEKQKICMFQFWLQFNVNASWKDIVQALEQNDFITLATNVKMKYVLSDSILSSTSQEQGVFDFQCIIARVNNIERVSNAV